MCGLIGSMLFGVIIACIGLYFTRKELKERKDKETK